MMIDLGRDALETIVKDGVKEILGKIGGNSRCAKKSGWFKAVKAAVQEYQQKMEKDFLPVLINDFSK
jgi:hypothetical protein